MNTADRSTGSRTYKLMGIVNLTDNSFFSPSRLGGASVEEAVARVGAMIDSGADIIDVGACSTAPGNLEISENEEWKRLEKFVPAFFEAFPDMLFSIDTFRPGIVRRLATYGRKFIVNDVRTASASANGMLSAVSESGLPYIAMDSSDDPYDFFRRLAPVLAGYGIEDWILDPGFGFGKTVVQNWEILNNLDRFAEFGRPVLAALSRKRMIYERFNLTPTTCAAESVAAEKTAVSKGASIIRTHDVSAHGC